MGRRNQTIPRHTKKDIEDVLKLMRKAGWTATVPFGHGFRVTCPHSCECKEPVYSTPTSPSRDAKHLKRALARCRGK